MQINNLNNMIRGWFVGNFNPSIIKTNDVEVSVRRFNAGDFEKAHFHKIATEITVIISGEVMMNNVKYYENDIIVMESNEVTDFLALTDAIITVVKYPGSNDDKYFEN